MPQSLLARHLLPHIDGLLSPFPSAEPPNRIPPTFPTTLRKLAILKLHCPTTTSDDHHTILMDTCRDELHAAEWDYYRRGGGWVEQTFDIWGIDRVWNEMVERNDPLIDEVRALDPRESKEVKEMSTWVMKRRRGMEKGREENEMRKRRYVERERSAGREVKEEELGVRVGVVDDELGRMREEEWRRNKEVRLRGGRPPGYVVVEEEEEEGKEKKIPPGYVRGEEQLPPYRD